jgi:hypothetical protein
MAGSGGVKSLLTSDFFPLLKKANRRWKLVGIPRPADFTMAANVKSQHREVTVVSLRDDRLIATATRP